jgi:anoctamin-9
MIGMAHVLVVYRVLAGALFSSLVKQQVTTAVVVTGAVVHYIIIVIMTKVRIRQGRPWGAPLKS